MDTVIVLFPASIYSTAEAVSPQDVALSAQIMRVTVAFVNTVRFGLSAYGE